VASGASLPLADQGRAWDGPGAASRMLNAASDGDKINKSEASRGFFKVDGDGAREATIPFHSLTLLVELLQQFHEGFLL